MSDKRYYVKYVKPQAPQALQAQPTPQSNSDSSSLTRRLVIRGESGVRQSLGFHSRRRPEQLLQIFPKAPQRLQPFRSSFNHLLLSLENASASGFNQYADGFAELPTRSAQHLQ